MARWRLNFGPFFLIEGTLDCDPEAADCAWSPLPPIYFLSFIIVGNLLMLRLIVAVIIDQFVELAINEGILTSANLFDAVQRKILLDRFVSKLKAKLERFKLAANPGAAVGDLASLKRQAELAAAHAAGADHGQPIDEAAEEAPTTGEHELAVGS